MPNGPTNLGQLALRIRGIGHFLPVHFDDHVTGGQTATGRWAARIDVHHEGAMGVVLQAQPPGHIGRDVLSDMPNPPSLILRLDVVTGPRLVVSASRSSSSTVTLSVCSPSSRMTRSGTVVPAGSPSPSHKIFILLHRLAVVADDHVARLRCPPLAAAPFGETLATSAPSRALEAEILHRVDAGTGCDLDANPPARDLAVAELRQQVADRVDRHREADADVGAIAGRYRSRC